MNILIVGAGEVGSAHARILSRAHIVKMTDIIASKVPKEMRLDKKYKPDLMLFAMRYDDKFFDACNSYFTGWGPPMIGVLSTVPVGTTRKISPFAFHSTTRGMHPRLDESLLVMPKHFGGPSAKAASQIFKLAGFPVPDSAIHQRAETTELAHILNNAAYGANIALAAEMEKICRFYGLDYTEVVMAYAKTNNAGFMKLDHPSKVRPVLTPPGKRIGGHCVVMSAGLVPKDLRGPILERVATFNDGEPGL